MTNIYYRDGLWFIHYECVTSSGCEFYGLNKDFYNYKQNLRSIFNI